MKPLPVSFYLQDSLTVARELIGCELIHQTAAGIVGGRIVETEAYTEDDPASHSFKGQTTRNLAMFGPAGTVYMYQIYGLHYCLNAVTGAEGKGEAVLIRALEPLYGIEEMQKARSTSLLNLCSGPAKLVEALAITPDLNGASLQTSPLIICQGQKNDIHITTSSRIGITKGADRPWRFHQTDSPFISRPSFKNRSVSNLPLPPKE